MAGWRQTSASERANVCAVRVAIAIFSTSLQCVVTAINNNYFDSQKIGVVATTPECTLDPVTEVPPSQIYCQVLPVTVVLAYCKPPWLAAFPYIMAAHTALGDVGVS